MSRFALMRIDAAVDFDAAARIYRTCRGSGVTPRGMIDCMIASVAMRNNASLLTADSDIDHVREIMGIPVEHH